MLTSREEGDRMIILVSDGYSSDLGEGQDMEITRMLREDGITLFAVHCAEGDIPGEVVNIARAPVGRSSRRGIPPPWRPSSPASMP
ncbi:MAG: VWA domain-containing protein [Planctomycetota bacterium]